MNTYPLVALKNAFDWFGLETNLQNGVLTIREGRIGLTNNPLILSDKGVSGGFYFPETSFPLCDTARFVDIVLDEKTEAVMVLIRSDTETERVSHEYRILLRLMQRDSTDSPWFVAEKEYLYD